MKWVRADELQVGDRLNLPGLLAYGGDDHIVTGVGTATVTYRCGFLWRKTRSYKRIKVATERVLLYSIGWPPTTTPDHFTFNPGDGLWIENRKETT